jgi:hypothetical protein
VAASKVVLMSGSMKGRVLSVGFAAALALAGLLYATCSGPTEAPSNQPENTRVDQLDGSRSPADAGDSDLDSPQGRSAQSLHILQDGQDASADIIIGAPAIYPPLEGQAVGGWLPVATSVDDEPLAEAEVLATNQTHGFWGVIGFPNGHIELTLLRNVEICTDDAEGGVPATKIRVGLAPIGFVAVHAITGEDGCVRISLPAGEFVYSVKAPGFLTSVVASAEDHLRIDMVIAAGFRGKVLDVDGRPVSGATVVAQQSLGAVALTATNDQGDYVLENVPLRTTSLSANAPGFVPTHGASFEPGRVEHQDLVLHRGQRVQVRVETRNGEPVSGALVQWRLKESVGAAATDQQGMTSFDNVPSAAQFVAKYQRFTSRTARSEAHVTLVIDAESLAPKLLRVLGVTPLAVRVLSEKSGECTVTGEGRDWKIEQCAEGMASVLIDTAEGTYAHEAILDDSQEIEVPQPRQTTVEFEGNWPFERSRVFLVQNGTRKPVDIQSGKITITSREAELHFVFSLGDAQKDVIIKSGGVQRVVVERIPRRSFRVVDGRRAPVTGAYVAVIRQGLVLDSTTSAGLLPLNLEVPKGAQVVAVDPRRGQGTLQDADDLIVLSESVGTEIGGVPSLKDVSRRMGVVFHKDGDGLRLETVGDTAKKKGVERGAWFVFAYSPPQKLVVILWQSGKFKTFKF